MGKANHYKSVCVSFYNEDIARIEELVKELKRLGFTKANRSAVLRAAIEQFDVKKVRKGL